jgi:hypothetical protein
MFGLGKKNAAIDAFAVELVADFVKRFPVEKEEDLGTSKRKPARSLGKAAGDLVDHRFAEFVAEQGLGVYGKARLLNQVKWQMTELGYSKSFIDTTLSELTVAMTRRAGAPAK